MAVATLSASLSELIATAKDYKRQWPATVGFVVGWIRTGGAKSKAYQLMFDRFMKARIGSSPQLLTYSITQCDKVSDMLVWLRKPNARIPHPDEALCALTSLAKDVEQLPGVTFPGRIETFKPDAVPNVLRWTVEATGAKRRTWLSSIQYDLADENSDSWTTDENELPCVFDAIARALESHYAKTVGFYCDPLHRSLHFNGERICHGLTEEQFAYVQALAAAWPKRMKFKDICKTSIHLESKNQNRFKDSLPLKLDNIINRNSQGHVLTVR